MNSDVLSLLLFGVFCLLMALIVVPYKEDK